MLAKLHTKHAYLHYIILIVLATGLWIRPLINGCWMVEAGDEIPFYQWLYTIIPTESIAVVFTGFTLVIIEAILLNYILIKHRLLPPNTYFTFYIYVLIMSQSPIVLTLNPVICGALFAIPSIGLILYINSHPKPATITFFSTVLMAIASMFCFEMIFFFYCFLSPLGFIKNIQQD